MHCLFRTYSILVCRLYNRNTILNHLICRDRYREQCCRGESEVRVLMVIIGLMLSGCASNARDDLYGNRQKSGWGAEDKIVYTDYGDLTPRAQRCGEGHVLWCAVDQVGTSCSCVPEQDVDARAARLFGEHERGSARLNGRLRQRD
jgi:hypothetical protein